MHIRCLRQKVRNLESGGGFKPERANRIAGCVRARTVLGWF